MLYLLIGFAVALAIGVWLAGTSGSTQDAAIAVSGTPEPENYFDWPLFCALAALAWFTAFYTRPGWFCFLHTLVVMLVAGVLVVGGALSAYWDHYMKPGDQTGRLIVGFGALMLASRLATFYLLWRKSAQRPST